jgi:hypothetical protein
MYSERNSSGSSFFAVSVKEPRGSNALYLCKRLHDLGGIEMKHLLTRLGIALASGLGLT